MAKIVIKRASGYADYLRRYNVILNGEAIGSIKNGETRTFDVSVGTHELHLEIDWCRSNKLHFQSRESSTEQFECESNLKGLKIFLTAIYLFMPDKWIMLRQVTSKIAR